MPHIAAFRGLRYDPGHVGTLEGVVAPPVDVIDKTLQTELYQQHPANAVRLILNRDEPGDQGDEKYDRTARFFRNWQREGVLQREPDPAIYVYHQVFPYEGSSFTRRGFIGLAQIEKIDSGSVYSHQPTNPEMVADRGKVLRACEADLSPVVGLYRDPNNQHQEILESAIINVAPIETKDSAGVVHRLWPVTDIQTINQLTTAISPLPTYIAAGRHQYEAATESSEQKTSKSNVMMLCISMDDPGMIDVPTHFLLSDKSPINSDDLSTKLASCFAVRVAGEGSDLAEMIWDQIEVEAEQHTVGLYCPADQRWIIAKLNDEGRAKLEQISPDKSTEWRSLGVNILHKLILETLLQRTSSDVVHSTHELIERLEHGVAANDGETLALAALVAPLSWAAVCNVAEHGESLPHRSKHFYPQVLNGLVFNPHDA